MQEKLLSIKKTARLYQSNEINEQTQNILLVLHGYGQLSKFFIKKFDGIANDQNVIIAPEGLNRFYLQGMSGRVGASWMTSEGRELDIEDNNQLLNSTLEWITQQTRSRPIHLHIIAFSQGAATALRWLQYSKPVLESLVIWAGSLPKEIDFFKEADYFQKIKMICVRGNQDEYFNEKNETDWLSPLKDADIAFETLHFEGGHDIDKKTVVNLSRTFYKNHQI